MTTTAALLLAVSALLHASWNALSKSRAPSAAFFLVAVLASTSCLLPVLVVHFDLVGAVPAEVWTLVLLTGLCQATYFSSLAGAYRHGHMSVAYPLARSSPVIVVTFVTLVLGRGDSVGSLAIAGIVLVVAGGFLLPMRHFRDLRLANYANASCAFALVAAFGTAGYSLIDDEALRLLRSLPDVSAGSTTRTVVFAALELTSTTLWLSLFVASRASSRAALRAVLSSRIPSAAAAGIASAVCYGLVLVSMAYVTDVSYVVGFRQMSIPIGALLGIILLKEPGHAPTYLGVATVFVGLVLIGVG